ncbi:MAG TPA: endonuclease Q family protein [Syntrophomonadaceae bacterium]|nr:endonuclease Q family protein [Syntrophomonadaceae bacterium]
MNTYFADLHIHIGQAGGRPIKITASRALQLKSLLYQDAPSKGLDIVGVVDAACLPVAREIEEMLESGELREHPRGGFLAANGILLIAAAEVESREGAHLIMYMPGMSSIHRFQKYLQSRVSNMSLSTQRVDTDVNQLVNLKHLVDGVLCPAHVFTPHKGLYGCCTERLSHLLGRNLGQISALELGLSADSDMVDLITECRRFTFLSNSDAHSSQNVGREYNLLRMREKSFQELQFCLEGYEGRRVMANYGMDPLLGKYHRSYCPTCNIIIQDPPPVKACPVCFSSKLISGVYDRIMEIRDYDEAHHPINRPPYYHRVPLLAFPGVGKKRAQQLIRRFGSEIQVLEKADLEEVARVGGSALAANLGAMRADRLPISPGGGGFYGKVIGV